MRQAEHVRQQTDRLRRRLVELWRSEHSAWWYRLIARTGTAQLVGFIVIGITVATVRADGQESAEYSPSGWEGWGSLLVGLAVAAYSYWSMEDPQPPAERVPGKEWGNRAVGKGIWVAVGVFYTTLLVCIFLVMGIDNIIDLLPLPRALHIAVGVILLGSSLLLPAMLAKRGYSERYRQEIEVLEAVTPPGLRLAMDLNRRAEWFHGHAEALERTMEQAAEISKQVQREIVLEHQQLSELHEQALRQARLNEVTPEQAQALARMLDEQHAEGERRAKRSNFRFGVLWYALGVATPLLIPDAARAQIQQWLHLT